jgi:hypothetical protein
MNYSIQNKEIIIKDTKEFDINHILDCGQVFRYSIENKKIKIIAKNVVYYLKSSNDSVIINFKTNMFHTCTSKNNFSRF